MGEVLDQKKKSVCVVDNKVSIQSGRTAKEAALICLLWDWVLLLWAVLLSLAFARALLSKFSLFTYIILATSK